MNSESFCERTLSCVNLITTDFHTDLNHEEVRMVFEVTETRISKVLRDKTEVQAEEVLPEVAGMDVTYYLNQLVELIEFNPKLYPR